MIYKNARETVAVGFSHDNDIVSNKNKFGFQDKLYSRTQNKNIQLITLTSQIFQTSTSFRQGIHPRLFCRRWFGLSATKENGRPRFTKRQIEAMESEHGYRERCINLLAKLLKIKPNTIQRWGKGVSFDKIPGEKLQRYEIYLGYIDAIRVITASLTELDEATLLKVLRQLEVRK